MSARTAGTTHSGLAPKRPAKKRQMIRVWMSFEVALPIVKMDDPSMPTHKGQRRPTISEPGAQKMGPKAKPRTKRLVPKAATTLPTWNSSLARGSPAAKMALLRDATNVPLHAMSDM